MHVYLYREGALYRASIYRMSAERGHETEPLQRFAAESEAEVEASARAFVEARFPKGT